jgi:PAS domain S-box-containing protein
MKTEVVNTINSSISTKNISSFIIIDKSGELLYYSENASDFFAFTKQVPLSKNNSFYSYFSSDFNTILDRFISSEEKEIIIRIEESYNQKDKKGLIHITRNNDCNSFYVKLVDLDQIPYDNRYNEFFNKMINGLLFFKLVLDSNNQAYNFEIIKTNKALEEFVQLDPTLWENKLLSDILQGADPEKIKSYAQSINAGERSFDEIYMRSLDRYIELAVFNIHSNFYGAIIHDITQLKKANIALKESESRYKLLAENTSDVIWVMDRNFKNTYISPSTVKFRGYTVEEHLEQAHEEILTPSSLQFVKEKLLKSIVEFNETKSAQPITIEVQYKHKNGNTIWAEANVSFIFDQQGNIFGFHGVSRNIQDRKIIEAKLQKSEKKFKSLINALPDLMMVISKRGDYKELYISDESQISVPKNVLLGNNMKNILPKNISFQALEIINKTITTKRNHKFEYPVNIDNKKRWFQASIAPFDIKDEEQVLWIAREITEKKLAEQELIAAKKKAEESDKLKSNFLANMSHEIRTPMNGILGFTNLLSEENIPPEERMEYVKLINNSTEMLLKLIDDIMDISKIEAGQLNIEKSTYRVNSLMNDLHALFSEIKSKQKKHGIQFILTKPENSEENTIYTDSMRFTQIMSNLINNAFKFTESGSIEIGYTNETPGKYIFFVKDTGIGIPLEKQEIIFERFRQIDGSSTRTYGGTGLGLTITKGLVELLGGSINVKSNSEFGSTFIFDLPRSSESHSSSSLKQDKLQISTENWNSKTILIAEDNEISFKLLENLLAKSNINILHAETGNEVIDILADNGSVDIILMDVNMPELDGLDAAKMIRDNKSNIPIIAQTAFAMQSDIEKCYNNGCNDIITKPINSKELFFKLGKYLNR